MLAIMMNTIGVDLHLSDQVACRGEQYDSCCGAFCEFVRCLSDIRSGVFQVFRLNDLIVTGKAGM